MAGKRQINLFSFKISPFGVYIWAPYICVLLSTFAVGKQSMSRLSSAAVHLLVLYYMILSGPDD